MAKGKKTGGRKPGSVNKTTALLKDAVLKAAELAGSDIHGTDGLVGYLRMQATLNPAPFMSLLGRVIPLQVDGNPDKPIQHRLKIEFVKAGE